MVDQWSTIKTHVSRGPLQCRYDYRLTTLDTTVLEAPLKIMFQEQTNAFKINLSYGFVMRNKNTGQYKYYHSSCNCCGRYLDEPSLITNSKDFDNFPERIRETDVLQWTKSKTGFCVGVRTRDQCHLLRQQLHRSSDRMCTGDPLPGYIKKKSVIEPIHHKRYNDNLCLFRCLALHRGCDLYRLEPAVKTLYEAYDRDDVPMEEFAGVTLDDFYRVETTFQTNVCVYKLIKPDAEDGKSTAELVRRSLCNYPETMYLNLHETHFSFIQDVCMYCNSYRCRKCGDSLWNKASTLRSHERTCTGGESLRYYPYRATFDFEYWFDTEELPSDSDKVHWVARHVPLSVSVASNVPGHEQCLVTDGDTNKLVSAMMDILRAMSEAAYDIRLVR